MSGAPADGGSGGGGRPENVGILAADVYFPSTYVAQVRLKMREAVFWSAVLRRRMS